MGPTRALQAFSGVRGARFGAITENYRGSIYGSANPPKSGES